VKWAISAVGDDIAANSPSEQYTKPYSGSDGFIGGAKARTPRAAVD